jgi:hypothetical protein
MERPCPEVGLGQTIGRTRTLWNHLMIYTTGHFIKNFDPSRVLQGFSCSNPTGVQGRAPDVSAVPSQCLVLTKLSGSPCFWRRSGHPGKRDAQGRASSRDGTEPHGATLPRGEFRTDGRSGPFWNYLMMYTTSHSIWNSDPNTVLQESACSNSTAPHWCDMAGWRWG